VRDRYVPATIPPQFYGVDQFSLAAPGFNALNIADSKRRAIHMLTTFNRIFTTQRLLQIIVVLGATIIMKLLIH
jgi:hypothetical protein